MKEINENISNFLKEYQLVWLFEKRFRRIEGKENLLKRMRTFLDAVCAAQNGSEEEFYDYLRPVVNEIRLDIDEYGKADVKAIEYDDIKELKEIDTTELQWAYAAFNCLKIIQWKELKNCKCCGRPFYGGGSKKIYCSPKCMTKANNYKPERDREKSRVRNFILRLQKRAVQIEPLLDEYLKKRNLKMSCVSDKWQKAMRKWERKKLLESDGVEPKKEEYA
jgi:hypothetical protein